jgi:DNA replication licensing factor MCM5
MVPPGYSSIQVPTKCDSIPIDGKGCPNNSYVILTDKCKFIDQQSLKLQEYPETVPTGEIPRSVILTLEKYLTETATPGTSKSIFNNFVGINIVGVYSTFNGSGLNVGKNAISIRYPYIRVVGINMNVDGSGRSHMIFSKTEEEEFIEMSKDKNIYNYISKSIDPAIFGHENIKKAIACQLFGGSSKKINDGIKRRGDINILLLGYLINNQIK